MEIQYNDRTNWQSFGPTTISLNFNDIVSETSETIVRVRYKATADKPASAIKVISIPKAYKPPTGAYLNGLYISGLKPGLPYELVYSDRFSKNKTYYGVVDSKGNCRREVIAGSGIGAVYSIRYGAYSNIGASPWKDIEVWN